MDHRKLSPGNCEDVSASHSSTHFTSSEPEDERKKKKPLTCRLSDPGNNSEFDNESLSLSLNSTNKSVKMRKYLNHLGVNLCAGE